MRFDLLPQGFIRLFLNSAFLLVLSSGCGISNVIISMDESDLSQASNIALKLSAENETIILNEGDRGVLLVLSDKAARSDILIDWIIAGEGDDFQVRSGITTLSKGRTSFSLALDVLDDSIFRPNRNYVLKFSSQDKSIQNQVEIDIQVIEDDPQYLLAFGSSSLVAQEGTAALRVPLQINTAHTSDLIIEYLVTGSAVLGTDVVITNPGIVTLPAGSNEVEVEVLVPDDFIVENPKNLVLTLYRVNLGGVEIGAIPQVTIQIQDNDLSIYPKKSAILLNETLQLEVSGGDGQYSFTITNGASSQVNASTGLLTAAGSAEEVVIRIQDGSGLEAESHIEIIEPTANPQLGLWLKADTLGLTLNEPVAAWSDQTAYQHDFSQSTAAARPLYISNVINGKPAVRFDGVNDLLESSYLPVTGANPRSVTTVLSNLILKTDSTVFSWGGEHDYGNAFGLETFSQKNNSFTSFTFGSYVHLSTGTAYPASFASPALGTPYIVTMQYDGTRFLYYVNGQAKGTYAQGINTTTVRNMRIGSRIYSNGYFSGDLAEIMVHQNLPSSSEREKLECYLSLKYQIALTSDSGCDGGPLSMPYQGHLTLELGGTHTLEVNGGSPPYSFRLVSGDGQIDQASGQFLASSNSGLNRVRVEDSLGQGLELDIHVVTFPRPDSWLDMSIQSYENNQSVEFLKDKSGNQRGWIQMASENQPIMEFNALNSLPALNFSGAQFLSGQFLPPTGNQPRTFAIVINEAQSGFLFDYGDGHFCDQAFTFRILSASGTFNLDRQCSTTASPIVDFAAPQILIVKYTGTHLEMRRNGQLIRSAAVTINTSSSTRTRAIRLGGARTGSGNVSALFNGKIAEFLAFSSNLNGAQQEALELYLSNKYNITLDP